MKVLGILYNALDFKEFFMHSELLRFVTSGSVDDGKSTLIGRLLVDTQGVYEDQLHAAQSFNERKGGQGLDLSLLTDGLQAEREQGITIDVAYRYFSTTKRKFIIADTPGHEQYTRNMVTGASTAEVSIVLIDARKGLLIQSRRHTCIAHLLGIRHVIGAINKMDLVNYDPAVYEQIMIDFENYAKQLGIPHVYCIPLSALEGDMVVNRGSNMPWYQGRTLLQTLEQIPLDQNAHQTDFRFPVQLVNRPPQTEKQDFRGYMGQVEAGQIQVGDSITVLPLNLTSKVKEIVTFDGEQQNAFAPQSVTITLEDNIDISRGDMLVSGDLPTVTTQLQARLCWFDLNALESGKKYWVKHTTQTVKGVVSNIDSKLDLHTLEHEESATDLQTNDIGTITLKLQKPLVIDSYEKNRTTGSFILIDTDTNNTVAGGMIL
jgi:sulfate adenylyltransferase subunit 1